MFLHVSAFVFAALCYLCFHLFFLLSLFNFGCFVLFFFSYLRDFCRVEGAKQNKKRLLFSRFAEDGTKKGTDNLARLEKGDTGTSCLGRGYINRGDSDCNLISTSFSCLTYLHFLDQQLFLSYYIEFAFFWFEGPVSKGPVGCFCREVVMFPASWWRP